MAQEIPQYYLDRYRRLREIETQINDIPSSGDSQFTRFRQTLLGEKNSIYDELVRDGMLDKLERRARTKPQIKTLSRDIENPDKISEAFKFNREYLGDIEYNFLVNFFGIEIRSSPGSTFQEQFFNFIVSLQEEFGYSSKQQDGKIGKTTLRDIYLKKYFGEQRAGNQILLDWKRRFDSLQVQTRTLHGGKVVLTHGFYAELNGIIENMYSRKDSFAFILYRYALYQSIVRSYNITKHGEGYRQNDDYFESDDVFGEYFYGKLPPHPAKIGKVGKGLIDIRIQSQIPPTIYDFYNQYRDFIPENQQDMLDGAFIVKDNNNKNIMIYYRGGELKFACYTTPGKASSGSLPDARVTDYKDLAHYYEDDKSKERRKSDPNISVTGGPMPLSVRISTSAGYYIHTGPTDGTEKSHGCFRLPTFFAGIFFHTAPVGMQIRYRPGVYIS